MESWYNLDKNQKKELRKEFKLKVKKIIDLRLLFYLLAIFSFFPLLIVIIAKSNNSCYENTCETNMIKYGMLFIIFLILGIINSILMSNREKNLIRG